MLFDTRRSLDFVSWLLAVVFVTATIMDQLRRLRAEAIAEIWAVLSEGELRAFTGVNEKLLENMRI